MVLTKVISHPFRNGRTMIMEGQGGLWKRNELHLGCYKIPNGFGFYKAHYNYENALFSA